MPRVSVIMAVRNGDPWVRDAVESVLAQTARDLELLVVDDASTDATAAVLASLPDRRLTVIRSEAPLGAVVARNVALRRASGELIAVLDADDVATPDRIERQAAEFARRPGLGLLGGWATLVNSDGTPSGREWPAVTGEALVAWNLMLFSNPLFHSACMYRRSLLDSVGEYDIAYGPSEDRDLWSRMLLRNSVDVLPTKVVRIRLHAGSISAKHRDVQRERSLAIRRRLLGDWTGDPAVSAAVDAWYDAAITPARAAALTRLFDLVIRRMETTSGRWAADDLGAVRADRDARVAALAGRVAEHGPVAWLRRGLRRLHPGV